MKSAARISVFPLDWSGGLVVLADVAHELPCEVGGGLKDAASDDLAFQLGKPELDLVEPAGVGRGEVKMHIGMAAEEVPDPLGLMSRQVVGDDMDLLVEGVLGDQCTEEGDELFTGMPCDSSALDLAGPSIERCVEREGAIADVFEAVAFGAARGQGQHRLRPVEGLDRSLLIDAEYDCVLRWVDVEPNHVERFGLEVGIVGSNVALHAMRLQTGVGPRPRDLHVVKAELACQPPCTPVGGPVGWGLHGGFQNSCLSPQRPRLPARALMSGIKTFQPVGSKACPPTSNEGLAATQTISDLLPRQPCSEQEHQARPLHVSSRQAAGPGARFEFNSFGFGKDDGRV